MTDQEYDVLDELYFLTSFYDLSKRCQLESEQLLDVLRTLLDKGWLNCFIEKDVPLMAEEVDLDRYYSQYYYLASKSGLFAHNSAI
jgi:hypothetical protein